MNTCKFESVKVDIIHPYAAYYDDSHLKTKVEALYEGETLDGIPHGWGKLSHQQEVKFSSFNGFVHMVKGELHGGPALFERGDGDRVVFSNMNKGRPHGFAKYYFSETQTANVKSLKDKMEVPGWSFYLGGCSDGRRHG